MKANIDKNASKIKSMKNLRGLQASQFAIDSDENEFFDQILDPMTK